MHSYNPAPVELAATGGDVQVIVDTARDSVQPVKLEIGEVYAVRNSRGEPTTLDLTGDAYRDLPKRKAGTTRVWDAESFVAYYAKHNDQGSDLYADVQQLKVTAVLDAHQQDAARWGQHRLVLELRQTTDWATWLKYDGKLIAQETFAQHIEDNLGVIVMDEDDIKAPSAAQMLEVAQSLEASTKVEFLSGVRLADGQRQLTYTETTQGKAGQKGKLDIPAHFWIGVQPFEGAQRYRVKARFQYRIGDGELRLAYRLEKPEEAVKAAFGDVVAALAESITEPIMNGSPA
ncbi:DUF2303 family protein [Streptacidiphilus sp. N1-12]|uniref:DUF2303 family protein n=2 Tax=Streptacidiphilus alkalitolerans TaxID=3342712 RepID=A0ABV6V9U7_9ACTN